jgi:hypothetical protein
MITDLEDFKTINTLFPHIGNRLQGLWGKDGFTDLVRNMSDQSAGEGLPMEIRQCLKKLLTLHEAEFKKEEDKPPPKPAGTDPASNELIKLVIEQYPRVGEQLASKWGTAAFPAYVNGLMNDTRGGTRAGFSESAAMALFRLMMQHDKEFPQFELKVADIWSVNYGG